MTSKMAEVTVDNLAMKFRLKISHLEDSLKDDPKREFLRGKLAALIWALEQIEQKGFYLAPSEFPMPELEPVVFVVEPEDIEWPDPEKNE